MDFAAADNRNSRIIRNTFYAQVAGDVVASLSSVIETLIDGVIIGQFLGLDAVSAFGIVSPLMVAFAMAGAVVSAGARTRYVRLVGEGKVQKAQAVFSLACLLALLFAAAMMLLVLVFATPLTRLLLTAELTDEVAFNLSFRNSRVLCIFQNLRRVDHEHCTINRIDDVTKLDLNLNLTYLDNVAKVIEVSLRLTQSHK